MASNPNPNQISSSMWRFWEEFEEYENDAELSGIYADKPGYHNYRANLPSSDYSVDEVANDKKGSSYYSCGIDLTLNESDMKLYSKRLDKAFKSKDKRLYVDGEPAVREFIGTLDGTTVYCYMLTGGVAQGVGADSGVDWGRDESHLWHIHLSFIRKFGDVWQIFSGVLSILKDQSYDDWEIEFMGLSNADMDNIATRVWNKRPWTSTDPVSTASALQRTESSIATVNTTASNVVALGSAVNSMVVQLNNMANQLTEIQESIDELTPDTPTGE